MKIDEGDREVKEENVGTRRLLSGFKQLNAKIYLLSGDLDSIFEKQKYVFSLKSLKSGTPRNNSKKDQSLRKLIIRP